MSPSGELLSEFSFFRFVSLCAVFGCALLLSVLSARAQTAATQQPQPAQETERPRRVNPPSDAAKTQDDDAELVDEEVVRVDTDIVMVDVSVTDAEGRPVRNLRLEDFKIYEDEVERPISFFNVERRSGQPRPVAVVFAVDASGSMTPEEMVRIGNAMRAFSKRLSNHPSVFAIMSFGMNVKVQQPFTSDLKKLDRALERMTRDINGLSTHAYDAIDDAVRMLVRNAPRTRERRLMKRAVVVITDGFPVGDTVAPQTVIERANAADVSIYTVTLPSYTRLLASVAQMPLPTPLDVSGLVEKTGGTNIYAVDKDYDALFKALAEEVVNSYVLAYYPPEEKRRDGRFHTIRISAPQGLQIRQSRVGYKAESGKQKAQSSR
ncbi:MAG TPA: VWA domain-containing protein [Pyrinomonadaceae bacterium]|jgi:Ca-activated chloride channel family protein